MAKQEERYENEGIDMDLSGMGSVLHGGSSVQQGMRGYSRRTDERGRNEFHGNGGSAELDPGRIHEGGRHYGRPAVAEPAPDGGPPGRPDLGEMGALQASQLQVIEADAMGPEALPPSSMLQTRHSEALFTQDRAEVETQPAALADRPAHGVSRWIEHPVSTARDAVPPVATPTRKSTARATPQTARPAVTRTVAPPSEAPPREARKVAAKTSTVTKPAAKTGVAKKAAVKVGAAKTVTAKTSPATKAPAKTSPVKKVSAKAAVVSKPAAKVTAATKAPAKAAVAKKASAKAAAAKKAPAKASEPKKATAKKVTAKKTVAVKKKTAAKKAVR